MPNHYLYLAAAVICEVFGTSLLKLSEGFTKPLPSLGVAVGFAGAFYFLSLTLNYMPIGVIYAVWSGLGIVLIAIVGLIFFGQKLDLAACFGMVLILAGVLIIHLFSDAKA